VCLSLLSIKHPLTSSEPVLLRQRAKRLSKITGNKYLSRRDAAKPLHTKELFVQSMKTPWILLFTEPIALLMALYMAVIYAILYVSHLTDLLQVS